MSFAIDKNMKEKLIEKASTVFTETIKKSLSDDKSIKRVSELIKKYHGIPKDAIADILIKNATRRTTIEGVANSGAITGCETVVALPIPEAVSKVAAVGGTVGLLLGDVTYTTSLQMQLIFDIAHLYDCPFDKDDEEDIWLIFKFAIGVKGVEGASNVAKSFFNEAAKKQFRAFLRKNGFRKKIQKFIFDNFGKAIAKYFGEKYVLRLIPAANIGIAAYFNHTVTKSVGKCAKVYLKIRSLSFKYIDRISEIDLKALIWVLPIIFHVGTYEEKLSDDFLTYYAHANKRLNLNQESLDYVEKLIDNEDYYSYLVEGLSKIESEKIKELLMGIAITTAAITLKPNENQFNCLKELSKVLKVNFSYEDLRNKIKYIKL